MTDRMGAAVAGVLYRVDPVATHALLAEVDTDAVSFCVSASAALSALDDVQAALPGSATVGKAMAGFASDRDTLPSWGAGQLSRCGSTVIVAVNAVVGADEAMVANTVVATDGESLFSSDRSGRVCGEVPGSVGWRPA